ncbi:MAG TPA: non-canonical purine NTP pyrophosphatase [bacterium]|nr:non-canonical purine NTP pyrophosphatase [bacterium]
MKKKLYLVTGNEHKYREFCAIVPFPIERLALDLPEIQSLDLEEVVRAKAAAAYTAVGKPVLVEDVSFEITAWHGLPGPFIKWFNQTLTPAGIARLMRSEADRSVAAREIIDLYDGTEHRLFYGEVTGRVAEEPRGESGFGFDTIFIPDGQERTYGEMSAEEKNTISHRAVALSKLKNYLKRVEEGEMR